MQNKMIFFFSFLIGNEKNLLRKKQPTRVYWGCTIGAKIKNQNFNDQVKQEEKNKNNATKPHSKQVEHARSAHIPQSIQHSSLQIHHIKQWDTSLQKIILRCCPNLPCQDSNTSSTLSGITQWSPNKQNIKDHNSKAMEQ